MYAYSSHKKMNSDYAEFKKLETIIREREDELRRKYVELQEKQAALKETSEYIQGRLDKLSMEKDYQVNNQKIKELEEALETLKKAQNERTFKTFKYPSYSKHLSAAL